MIWSRSISSSLGSFGSISSLLTFPDSVLSRPLTKCVPYAPHHLRFIYSFLRQHALYLGSRNNQHCSCPLFFPYVSHDHDTLTSICHSFSDPSFVASFLQLQPTHRQFSVAFYLRGYVICDYHRRLRHHHLIGNPHLVLSSVSSLETLALLRYVYLSNNFFRRFSFGLVVIRAYPNRLACRMRVVH